MSEKRLAGWAASSQTPEEISNRIKGLTLALSAVIIYFAAQFFGIQLSAADVVQLGTLLGATGGAVWALYGAGLALVKWVATVK